MQFHVRKSGFIARERRVSRSQCDEGFTPRRVRSGDATGRAPRRTSWPQRTSENRMKNRLLRVSMVAVLALGVGSVVTAAPSDAAAPVQKCTKLTGSATLSPGIQSAKKAQKVTAKGTLAGCTPAAGKTGGSGTITASLKVAPGNCTTLANGGSKFTGTAKTVWKNKKTSNYTLTFTTGKG